MKSGTQLALHYNILSANACFALLFGKTKLGKYLDRDLMCGFIPIRD